MRPGETISQFVKRVKSIAHRLSATGYAPGEDEKISALLNGLPEEYKTLVRVLESQRDDLRMSSVTTLLPQQESKIQDQENSNGVYQDSESVFQAKSAIRCGYCKRRCHVTRECRTLKHAKRNFRKF